MNKEIQEKHKLNILYLKRIGLIIEKAMVSEIDKDSEISIDIIHCLKYFKELLIKEGLLF